MGVYRLCLHNALVVSEQQEAHAEGELVVERILGANDVATDEQERA